MADKLFNIHEAAYIAGMTRSLLNKWSCNDTIEPAARIRHAGTRADRMFSLMQVFALTVAHALKVHGTPHETVEAVMSSLGRITLEKFADECSEGKYFLAAVKTKAYFCNREAVDEILEKFSPVVSVVNLDVCWKNMQKRIKQVKKKNTEVVEK